MLIIFSLFAGLFANLNAQDYLLSGSNKKAIKYYKIAEQEFRQQDYKAANEALQVAVKKDNNFIEAWLLLGDVLTELKQFEDAVVAYQRSIQINPTFFPKAWYFLGNLEFKLGDYRTAGNNFREYLQFREEPESLRKLVTFALDKALFAEKLLNNPTVTDLKNCGENINTSSDDYINFVNETGDELMLTRKELVDVDRLGRKLYTETFYMSIRSKGNWQPTNELVLDWNEGLNLGGMNVAVDGRKMYFTGCNWPNGFGSCDLYVSFRNGLEWHPPTNLGTVVNSQWWDSQPVITSDGKRLYFASRRAGGKGGSDIWMAIRLNNGKWSPPINLGDSINTKGNEMSPFIHADGNTLYFSSDGHFGLGGADLFVSKKDPIGRWMRAINMGYPLNTRFDEVNIFVNLSGGKAWVSSNREGEDHGFDIYNCSLPVSIKPGKVYFVKGIVKDAQSGELLSAVIELTDLTKGEVVDASISDNETGAFLMVLHPTFDYAFNILKPGYMFYSENLDLKENPDFGFVDKVFELMPMQKGSSMVLDNIFFDFDQSGLQPASFAELNRLSMFLKEYQEVTIQISGHTDNMGSVDYNLDLSTRRAKAVFNYLVESGISPDRLSYKGYGSERPVTTNDTERGRAKNRRTEITVL